MKLTSKNFIAVGFSQRDNEWKTGVLAQMCHAMLGQAENLIILDPSASADGNEREKSFLNSF